MSDKVFAPQFNRVKGISDKRRLPRLGKIRQGIKARSAKTGAEYPKETDYFVCPLEVQKVFGEQPKELEIMFPINEIESVFPQSYTFYGSGKGVKCKGDGEVAMERSNDHWQARKCPCEKLDHGCSLRGHLMFLIPKVSVGGVYQLDTGSYNSTVDINSCLDYVSAMVGRFAMLPLYLKRTPRETHHDGQKQTHYTLSIELRVPIDQLEAVRRDTNRIITATQYQLPPAEEENPAMDEEATVVITDEEEKPEATGNELLRGSIEQMMQEMYGDEWMDKLAERTQGKCKTVAEIPEVSLQKIYDKLLTEYNEPPF